MAKSQIVSISDSDTTGKFLAFDVREILSVLGDSVIHSKWTMRNVKCFGDESADEIHRISDAGRMVSGVLLQSLIEGVSQTIEGEFWGYHDGEQIPWIKIRTIDGSGFDIETSSDEIVEAVQERFRETKIH